MSELSNTKFIYLVFSCLLVTASFQVSVRDYQGDMKYETCDVNSMYNILLF